jgi:hypothetical protein
MLSENEILLALDNSNNIGDYSHFITLGEAYSYLIDCRLNIFRSEDGKWAIVAERLGYSERGGAIAIEIDYFGNCLQNLEEHNGQQTNNYTVSAIDAKSFDKTTDGFYLYPDAAYWLVKDKKITLSTNVQDYLDNDIEPNLYEPDQISVHEAVRLAIITQSEFFRADDVTLYKSIPHDLKKILVLDEWFHKDYVEINEDDISDYQLRAAYDQMKQLGGLEGIDFSEFQQMSNEQVNRNKKYNEDQRANNRPSSYETWQQLARVIATGDTSFYKPSLAPNTHWKNWTDSGSL